MKVDQFEILLDVQLQRVREMLVAKRKEYAADADVLYNFKKAAMLRGCSLPQAVSGMMAKHTVSVFDMAESGLSYPLEVWDEKITDHLNYLILLQACLMENVNQEQEKLC
jgi:hypothetical protein